LLYVSLISDIATDANRLIICGDQVVRGGANRSLIDIRERDGSARLGEGLGRRQAYARSGAGNECDCVLKRQVHSEFLSHRQGR
jgi:hypothetical protein